MDLQTRKLSIIKYLIGLKDESIFDEIEATIIQSKYRGKRNVIPMTQSQLRERARRSTEDYEKGSIKSQDQLEIESEKW